MTIENSPWMQSYHLLNMVNFPFRVVFSKLWLNVISHGRKFKKKQLQNISKLDLTSKKTSPTGIVCLPICFASFEHLQVCLRMVPYLQTRHQKKGVAAITVDSLSSRTTSPIYLGKWYDYSTLSIPLDPKPWKLKVLIPRKYGLYRIPPEK